MEGGQSFSDEDLQEEEVWAVVKEREDSGQKVRRVKDYYSSGSCSSRLPSAPRVNIPRSNNGSSGDSTQHELSSAPVKVLDCSKICTKNKKGVKYGDYVVAVTNEDDEVEEMVPPHEYLARRLARTQIASFSMCEGAGRTLKGRDLSKVRNAILTKTGFIE